MVLEAVARLEPRWETELSSVEFAVQEVPDADTIGEDEGVPLARIVSGSPDTSDPGNPATGPRIVLYRRPLMARAEDEDELSELIFDVVVEEFAEILGVDPDVIDPGYGEVLARGDDPPEPPATGGIIPPDPPLARSRRRNRGPAGG